MMADSSGTGRLSIEQVRRCCRSPITRPRVSFYYVAALWLVSLVILTLPLIYLSLMAGVGWFIWWHVAGNVPSIERTGMLWQILWWLMPAIAALLLLVFMIKPIFARRRREASPYAIERHQQPVLFEFVDVIAEAIGAPRPKRIELMHETNAAASFSGSIVSFFRRDLTLTIGMPLITGLSAEQLAGVIAHELGHFSQGAGMRLSHVIRAFSNWLGRIVYEPDAWDDRLRDTASDSGGWVALTIVLARILIWLTRRILWLFMVIGHLFAGFLLREMEFNADEHQVRLVGADVFEQTMHRMLDLSIAEQRVLGELPQYHAEGRLPDNLAELIAAFADDVPTEVRTMFAEMDDRMSASLFSTHPGREARLAAARRLDAEGVLRLKAPASALLHNGAVIGKWLSLSLYQSNFNAVDANALQPTGHLLRRKELRDRSHAAAQRYFGPLTRSERRVFLSRRRMKEHLSAQQAKDLIGRTRRAIEKSAAQITSLIEQSDQAEVARRRTVQAEALLKANVRFRAARFKLSAATRDAMLAARREAMEKLESLQPRFTAIEDAFSQRMFAALMLLGAATMSSRLPDAPKLQKHARRLIAANDALREAWSSVEQLRDAMIGFGSILSAAVEGDLPPEAMGMLREAERDVTRHLHTVRSLLKSTDYPFEGRRGLSLSEYAIGLPPPSEDDPLATARAADESLDKLDGLAADVLARLAVIAERVEAALDLQPISFSKAATSSERSPDAVT